MAYLSDCSSLTKENLKNLKNLRYLFIDCLRLKSHPTHLNLQQTLEIIKILNPKKTFLVNLGADLDFDFLLKVFVGSFRCIFTDIIATLNVQRSHVSLGFKK